MKLLVNIGTDYHLNLLPHFLHHYTALGVKQFLCGLHGSRLKEAQQILADYPVEIVACFGAVRFDEVASRYWKDNFNRFRREHVQPDEWCLYADADELHEYPPDFFAHLDPQINVVRGQWIERLATQDGRLLPCWPDGNIGQQYPFGTREIFCGISEKIIATRGDLEVVFGYHWLTGGTDTPVYYEQYLNVHHFRWDDLAVTKYQDRKWTRHYQITNGRVPDLHDVFVVYPPFPPAANGNHHDLSLSKTVDTPSGGAPPVIWIVGDGRSETTWLANLINYQQAYRFMFEPLHPWLWRFRARETPYLYPSPHREGEYLPIFWQIFSGQLHNEYVDGAYGDPGRRPLRDGHSPVTSGDQGLLIKDSFGHFCLKWVDEHFPHVKKILLLRHPFAVALAKRKQKERNWPWLNEPKLLLENPHLFEQFLRPFAEVITEAESDFEKQVLAWAIIHYVAFAQLNGAQIHLVFYEELCANFEQEMRRLLAYLGDDASSAALAERLWQQGKTPAATAQEFSAIQQNGDLLDGWRQQLTAEELGMGDYILNVFGLGQLYNSSRLRPNRQAAEFLLKASSRVSTPALPSSTP